MLHTVLFTDDKETAELLQWISKTTAREFAIDRAFCPMPVVAQLHQLLAAVDLDVIFLDVSDPQNASQIFHTVREKHPGVTTITFTKAEAFKPDVAGLPFLDRPFTPESVLWTLKAAVQHCDSASHENLFAFIPAKAGGGASTVAFNTAGHLAQMQQKVVVLECDHRSGVLSEMLQARGKTASTAEALHDIDVVNTTTWNQYVYSRLGVDFVLATKNIPGYLPQWHEYRKLVGFAASQYQKVIVDLPEAINDATAEIIRKAKTTYVVTTPELPSLVLAKRRLAEIREAEGEESRVRILVNRWHSKDMPAEEVERTLGCPVEAVFPNNYRAVSSAAAASAFVPRDNPLGQAFQAFAGILIRKTQPEEAKAEKSGMFSSVKRMFAPR